MPIPNLETPAAAARDWWNKKGKELAAGVSSTLKVLDGSQQERSIQLVRAARLYGSLPSLGVPGLTWTRPTAGQGTQRDRLTFNVVQSAVDTVTSKLGKNKPKPLFVTKGGNYKQQRKAKKLNQFTEGMFYENKAHDIGVMAFRDGCISGDGLVHVFERHGRVAFERVPASELYVDELEGLYGSPRQLHRVMNVDRGVLKALTGKNKLVADAHPAAAPPTGTPNVADAVQVRESWHLPSGPDAKDGRHALTIHGETLLEEEWPHDWFPFARFQWCPRQYGYWSQGLAEQITNIQIEINKIMWSMSESYRLAAMSVIFMESSSKVVPSHLTNLPGAIVKYTGTMPTYATPGILPPETYQHLAQLKQSAYEQAGISQLSANSQKPAGLNSGKALREYNDIESDRFMTIGHAYENFYLDLAAKGIAIARDIAEREGGYAVQVPSRSSTREVDWTDIDLEPNDYVMQCFPVSSLPDEPAARFQTVQEWVQAGWYTARQGKKLMNFPDLEAVDSLSQAAEDWLTKVLDGIVDDGEYTAPAQEDDLELGYELALEYLQHGKVNGAPRDRLDMLRTFMAQIDAYRQQAADEAQKQAQQQAQTALLAQAASGGAAQAPAVPPNPTELIPNTPGAQA
jgi:hypothetical protein